LEGAGFSADKLADMSEEKLNKLTEFTKADNEAKNNISSN
jgi:hypothetical protein